MCVDWTYRADFWWRADSCDAVLRTYPSGTRPVVSCSLWSSRRRRTGRSRRTGRRCRRAPAARCWQPSHTGASCTPTDRRLPTKRIALASLHTTFEDHSPNLNRLEPVLHYYSAQVIIVPHEVRCSAVIMCPLGNAFPTCSYLRM